MSKPRPVSLASYGTRLLRRSVVCVALSAGAVAAVPGTARADVTYSFTCITNNSPWFSRYGEEQFSVTASDPALPGPTSYVDFLFNNEGPHSYPITDIYFDDNAIHTLAAFTGLWNSAGVQFTSDTVQTVKPYDLPGGDTLANPFHATHELSVDADLPARLWGIDPGEWLKLRFSLPSGKQFSDVLQELGDGDLRIGIFAEARVRESFIDAVAAPGLAAMSATNAAVGGSGLLLTLVFMRLRRREQA